MMHAFRERRVRRWILLVVGLCVLAALWRLAPAVLSVNRFPVDDFVEYWAAGRLNLTGGSPYSIDELAPLQQTVGLGDEATIRMWNPPWTLVLVVPFALFPYPVARLLWLLLNLALLVGAVTYIWWYYDGPPQRRWVALLVLATYLPALFVLRMGQIAPLMLIGILGFLHFEGRRRWLLAGGFAALVAIKPHLIYLFWVALALWIIDYGVWKALLGILAALAGGVLVAWLVNHNVIGQYLAAAAKFLPWDWATPTIGGGLRLVFGYEHVWLLWLAPAAGTLWYLWYWRKQRRDWCWAEQMPLLLVVSLATTPYGWEYDQVVSLLAVLQVAVWMVIVPWGRASTLLLIGYLALNSLALAINIARINAFFYLWLAPAFLVWYLLAQRWLRRGPQASRGGDPVLGPAGYEA